MAQKSRRSQQRKVAVEYENLDMPFAYVEAAQGALSQKGALHVNFFMEYIKSKTELRPMSTVSASDNSEAYSFPDPFGMDGQDLRVVRSVQANLIFSEEALEVLVPWLQQKLAEMKQLRALKEANRDVE